MKLANAARALARRVARLLDEKRRTEQMRAIQTQIEVCRACQQTPTVTWLDDARSVYHITCTTASCPHPTWTDAFATERTLDEAVVEWNAIQAQTLRAPVDFDASVADMVNARSARARFTASSREHFADALDERKTRADDNQTSSRARLQGE